MKALQLLALLCLFSSPLAAEEHTRPFTYVVPFHGGVPGAETVYYRGVVVLTNPTSSVAHFKVDAHFDLHGTYRDPRCFCLSCEREVELAPHETTPIVFHACGSLAAYVLSSSTPLFITNDVEEYAEPGVDVKTGVSTIPVQNGLFPAGATAVIPNVTIVPAGSEKARANLVFFSHSAAATTDVHVRMSRRAGVPDPPNVHELTLTLPSNALHILPLPFIGDDILAPYFATQVRVSSDAPFYAGASQIIGRHTAYRHGTVLE